MLAYAAGRSTAVNRESSPHAFLVIVGVHVAVLAAVMSAKMEFPVKPTDRPLTIDLIRERPDPPPLPAKSPRETSHAIVTRTPDPFVQPKLPSETILADNGAADANVVINGGGGTDTIPVPPRTMVTPVHHDARLLTPPSELKPPYPSAKLLTEEEATLTLRLSIDSSGRVTAVEPVGKADQVFVDAARRHLLAHWRYQPATEGDRAIPSSVTITLRFMLDA